jgi:hypothetical protein
MAIITKQPQVGDLRVVEYDPGEYEIELFHKHDLSESSLWTTDPFWALPNWAEMDVFEFVGPFAERKEAEIIVRIAKNNGKSFV